MIHKIYCFFVWVVFKLHFDINHNLEPIILGSSSSMLVGEVISDGTITGHNTADVIIKITVPIITGVLIPIVKQVIDERKKKRHEP